MLAHVTYSQEFIMADSEDEFVLICVAASAAFVANNPKHLPAGRRAGVGWPAISNIFDTAGRRRARRTADATIFGTHITDARPMQSSHFTPSRLLITTSAIASLLPRKATIICPK